MVTCERLDLAVDALAKSINSDRKKAEFHFANAVFGSSWQKLKSDIESGQSNYLTKDITELTNILECITHSLSADLNIPLSSAGGLTVNIEPFSDNTPRPHPLDLEKLKVVYEHELDNELTIKVTPSLEEVAEHLFDSLKEESQYCPHAARVLEEVDSVSTLYDINSIITPIMSPIPPYNYALFLERAVKWPVELSQLEDEHTPLEPSFHLENDNDDLYPVYIHNLSCPPAHEIGEEMDDIISLIEEIHSCATILFRMPIVKLIGIFEYTVVGMHYAKNYWSYITLCDIPPAKQHEIIGPLNSDLETPILGATFATTFTDEGISMNIVYYSCLVNDRDEDDEICVSIPHRAPFDIDDEQSWFYFLG